METFKDTPITWYSVSWRSKLVFFLVFVMVLALVVDFSFYFLGGLADPFVVLVWGLVRMYTPAAAAVIVAGLGWFKSSLRISGRVVFFYLFAPLIIFLTLLIYMAITIALGVFTPDPLIRAYQQLPIPIDTPTLASILVINSYIAAITINSFFALGEEIGWRGFLQEWLESRGLGLVRASLVVGVFWGLWHASAILLLGYNYPENRLLGVPLFTALTITMSVPHAVFKRLSSSVLPAASLHGAINAVWGITLLTTSLPREAGGFGPLALLSWTIISAALYFATRAHQEKHLQPSSSQTTSPAQIHNTRRPAPPSESPSYNTNKTSYAGPPAPPLPSSP